MQTFEGFEQIARVRHVKTRAVVAHEIGAGAVGLRQCSKFNPRARMLCREFPRVAEQILQHHSQQLGVALDSHSLGDDPVHQTVRIFLFQVSGHGIRQGAKIEMVHQQLVSHHIGQRQQGINDVLHVQATPPQPLNVIPAV